MTKTLTTRAPVRVLVFKTAAPAPVKTTGQVRVGLWRAA